MAIITVPRSFGGTLLLKTNSLPTIAAVHTKYPIGSSPAFYRGETVVPVLPSGIYLVNGVPLDSQPVICTAPLESGNGLRFLVGSTFFLLFESPTDLTRNLLPNGAVISMTFALADGHMVTGSVHVESARTNAENTFTYSVVCTLLSSVVPFLLPV